MVQPVFWLVTVSAPTWATDTSAVSDGHIDHSNGPLSLMAASTAAAPGIAKRTVELLDGEGARVRRRRFRPPGRPLGATVTGRQSDDDLHRRTSAALADRVVDCH